MNYLVFLPSLPLVLRDKKKANRTGRNEYLVYRKRKPQVIFCFNSDIVYLENKPNNQWQRNA